MITPRADAGPSWSLAAGIDIFTLARRMGTSVKMIDRTYGPLVAGAGARERELLDAFENALDAIGTSSASRSAGGCVPAASRAARVRSSSGSA